MISVYGLFKPSLTLQLALDKLRENDFTGDKLMVVTLDPCPSGKQTLLDSMHSTDGTSLVDGIAMSATIGMVLGVIYGSQAYIGPIALGLLGMGAGGGVGYLLDRLIRKKTPAGNNPPAGEIILIIKCSNENESARAEKIMQEHRAAALGRGPNPAYCIK